MRGRRRRLPEGHWLARLLAVWVINALALLFLSWLLRGFDVDGFWASAMLAAVMGLMNAIIWPLCIRFALPLTVMTLGLGVLVLNAVFIWIASEALDEVYLADLWSGLWVAIGVTIMNTVVTSLFAIDDDDFYYRNVIKRQAQRSAEPESDLPGVLILEVDGLAHDVLRRALRDGNAPTLARWIREGDHHLAGWECDWSSQTGAMQAGILQGSNWDMPGFRWWEKDRQAAFVANAPRDAMEIERRHSNGKGLLHAGGASRANLVSGDAAHSLLTMSTVLRRREGRIGADYYAFFVNPYNTTRTAVLAVREIVVELWQQTQQRRRDIQPRVHRGWFPYPLLRVWTNVLQRDLSVAATIQDLYAGRPVIYTMFLGYDEVAHHSGIERAETLHELFKIDRAFARLERAARDASREYRIIVLSDHGQTQGATFLQRYGHTLEAVVDEHSGDAELVAPATTDEGWGYLSAAATEAGQGSGAMSKAVRAATRKSRDEDGAVQLGAEREVTNKKKRRRFRKSTEADAVLPEVVVMASGCLGLISFPHIPGRASAEAITQLHPRLIEELRVHPGIGFVLVRSEDHGAVVLGKHGVHFLDRGRVDGEDPLLPYGENAAAHVARTDSFPHCPDILVNSTYWEETGEVAAFEELCGSHGGMGGTQSHPFVLYPSDLSSPKEQIVGAGHLHLQLRLWLAELGHDEFAEPFAPVGPDTEPAVPA